MLTNLHGPPNATMMTSMTTNRHTQTATNSDGHHTKKAGTGNTDDGGVGLFG